VASGCNFGVGTSTPTTLLDIAGDVNFSGNLLKNGAIYQSGTPGLCNNSSNVYVASGCNFGVGTSTPTTLLDIAGDVNFSGNLLKNGAIYQSGTPGLCNNSSNVYVASGCNFGIGTSTHSKLFHVAGDALVNGDLSFNGNLLKNGANFLAGLSNASSNVLVATGCNFAIGTTSPQKTLHVVGDSMFDGNIINTNRAITYGRVNLARPASTLSQINLTTALTGDLSASNLAVTGNARFDGNIELYNRSMSMGRIKLDRPASAYAAVNITSTTTSIPGITVNGANSIDFALSNTQSNYNFYNKSGGMIMSMSNTGTITATGDVNINGFTYLGDSTGFKLYFLTGTTPAANGNTTYAYPTGVTLDSIVSVSGIVYTGSYALPDNCSIDPTNVWRTLCHTSGLLIQVPTGATGVASKTFKLILTTYQ